MRGERTRKIRLVYEWSACMRIEWQGVVVVVAVVGASSPFLRIYSRNKFRPSSSPSSHIFSPISCVSLNFFPLGLDDTTIEFL